MSSDEIQNSSPSSDQEVASSQQIKKGTNTTGLGCMLNRIAGIPYLLVLLALILPIFTVKCSDVTVAEFNAYEITVGGDMKDSSLGSLSDFSGKKNSGVSTHYDASPLAAGVFICVIVAAVFCFKNKTVQAIVAAGVSILYIWLIFLMGYFKIRNASTDTMGLLTVSPGAGIYLSMVFIAIALVLNIIALTHKDK